ncbi:N-acetyltransferase [Nocardioides sp. zg-ZUI104]|uniref:GNAT family N-acetyltransferase n=1 Tax=Nocardioides faecalis TaxID=2803858 RepID=UPI001BCECCAB|nr:N-acetyltransferase [Nocardioides faecalis]MBS4754457.1 N-acetyltransferase [Nocardioides faecalis]
MSTPTRIRLATPADTPGIEAVLSAAFDADIPGIVAFWREVVGRGLVRAELVAEHDGRVVGHLGLSHAWLDAEPRLVDVLVVGPLSIDPEHQDQGIGSALLDAARTEGARQLAPYLVLEGEGAYYCRKGFVPAHTYGLLPPSDRVAGDDFLASALETREPWMHGRVVYHDLWWESDAIGLFQPA